MTAWKDKFIQPNQYSRPQKKITAVRKIVIHWTANYGATALNHYNYFNSLKDRYASAHFFVDKTEALCIIPLNEIAYHANDGTYKGVAELKPNANFLSIGVEMCVEKDGSFHPDTIARTIQVVAELCEKYNLDPINDIVRHYDVTHKSCPTPWVRDSAKFTAFKKTVDAQLGKKEVASKPAPKPVEKPVEKPKPVTPAKPKPKPVAKPKPTGRPMLKVGSKGQQVKDLQYFLAKKGYNSIVDGIFGTKTKALVIKFQKDNKLVADGIVGEKTWQKLV